MQGKGLFQDYIFLLYGHFPLPGPPSVDIADLVEAGGAQIIDSFQKILTVKKDLLQTFQNSASSEHLVVSSQGSLKKKILIVTSNADDATEFFDLLSEECVQSMRDLQLRWDLLNGINIFNVTPMWVLDSITNFHCLPEVDYHAQ